MWNRRTGARGWRHKDIHKVVGVRIDITTKTLGGGVNRHGRISLANRRHLFFFLITSLYFVLLNCFVR